MARSYGKEGQRVSTSVVEPEPFFLRVEDSTTLPAKYPTSHKLIAVLSQIREEDILYI